jgi:pyrroloquinoline quinone biosynthesis protein B
MKKQFSILLVRILIFILGAVTSGQTAMPSGAEQESLPITGTSLIVLGTVQDGGSPHIGCSKECCRDLFISPDKNRKVVSLGLIDPEHNKKYLFEATPDLPQQMKLLKNYASFSEKETPDAILLTHAHIGHYTGLMYLGKEAMDADKVPVFAMPRMKAFLEKNGPWSQLVIRSNISIQEMSTGKEIQLTPNVRIVPFMVPHRDEYSETVGFLITGPNKSALFIPDIDKWEKWESDIIEEISRVDYAFIDGTFYDGQEINNRDISEIPHPFIIESMAKFKGLPREERKKIYFIHLNHTNPALNPNSEQVRRIVKNGYNVARIFDIITL